MGKSSYLVASDVSSFASKNLVSPMRIGSSLLLGSGITSTDGGRAFPPTLTYFDIDFLSELSGR